MQTKLSGAICAVLYVILCSCGGNSATTVSEDPAVNAKPDSLPTATAELSAAVDEIKLNGKVLPNESRQAKVYALVSGKISQATKELGDYVQKGQTLAVLRSTEVVSMSSDISLAEANVAMAKKSMEAMNELYKGDLATEREAINARLEYNKALAELNRAKQVSSITGGQNAHYTLKAPVSGFIIEKNITNNSEVRQDNDTPLFTIADLTNVWVMANVYERDINNVHIGDEVSVKTLSDPNKEYNGKIDKIYNVLNTGTRTMQVRISMLNTNYELKPEMFATVKVKVQGQTQQVSVPYEALLFDDGRQYVVVKQADGKMERREVKLLKKTGDKAFVEGVQTGEKVVTGSQVFLFGSLNSK